MAKNLDQELNIKTAVNYRPKLYLENGVLENNDPLAANAIAEITQYSITPKTLVSRKFFSKENTDEKTTKIIKEHQKEISKLGTRLDQFKEVEYSRIDQLKILSANIIEEEEFAKPDKDILELAGKFSSKIENLSGSLLDLEQFIDLAASKEILSLLYQDTYSNQSTEIVRFGINASALSPELSLNLASICVSTSEKRLQ